MIIRKAIIKDFLEISKLDREVWGKKSKYVPDGEHVWRIWIEYSYVYCIEENNKIVAVIVSFSTNNEKLYFLHKIFVHTDFRNNNYGLELFKILCKKLDEEKLNCYLTTDPENYKMVKLCNYFKFNNREYISSYYGEGKDRFLYKRIIN